MALAAVAACLLLPAAAAGAGLPSVGSGQRPGPPLLYAEPPVAPQLAVQAPFAAQPLLVSGTDAVRGGEYLYQDYLFDDRGANTVPGLGTQPPGTGNFSPSAGDIRYPDEEDLANNAADLVEVRVRPTEDAVLFRLTFNTVRDAAVPIATVAIDTDRAGAQGDDAWPRGAGLTTAGVEHFVTAWDGGGEVTHSNGDPAEAVGSSDLDPATNQLTVSVPRSVLDPGSSTWRLSAGAGLRAAGDVYREVAPGTPAEVFNLAFRFAEPQSTNPAAGAGTFPGVGNFFEDGQAKALAAGKTDGIHADVDFGALAAGTDSQPHPPGRTQARIMPSALGLPEGVRSEFPQFGGNLQPYLLRVPEGVGTTARPAGLTLSMHSLGGTYTQYAVFSPRQLTQFGDERANLVATPLGHGPDGWYTDEAEADVFEVWRDVAQHFALDPDRTLSDRVLDGRLRHVQARHGVPRPVRARLHHRGSTGEGGLARGESAGPGWAVDAHHSEAAERALAALPQLGRCAGPAGALRRADRAAGPLRRAQAAQRAVDVPVRPLRDGHPRPVGRSPRLPWSQPAPG